MLASASLISCNFSPILSSSPNTQSIRHSQISLSRKSAKPLTFPKTITHFTPYFPFPKKGALQICSFSKGTPNLEDSVAENEITGSNGSGGGDQTETDWTTSILLFVLWAALMYYVFNLTPDQTPSRDEYFLKKLLNLKGDDGFRMNDVLVALWYIMGLWPIVYSMLLLPTGRSSKSSIPAWPFSVLSFFGGAYVLLPYFILWRPPPPPIEEDELQKWPLNFLESKITAGVLGAAGLGLIIYAGLAIGDWKEFFQYFRESKLVHVTSLDFMLLSTFAPFWVYNDMTARKCFEKYSWLLPFSVIPFIGPSLYLLLRPLPPTVANIAKTREDAQSPVDSLVLQD
ncbi:hypothetical protein V2J09_020769 [Rumex salicifolius]